MIDRIDEQPTPKDHKIYDRRTGKDRRNVHTMVDPDKEKEIDANREPVNNLNFCDNIGG